MKIKMISIPLIALLLILYFPAAMFGEETGEVTSSAVHESEPAPETPLNTDIEDAVSRAKLRAESLPQDMQIVDEVWATAEQLVEGRKRTGVRLRAILTQIIAQGKDRAEINYIFFPDATDIGQAYTMLAMREGQSSMIIKKDNMILQILTGEKALEDRLIFLLKIDPLQTIRIRFHRTPREWKLSQERFFEPGELMQIQQKTGVMVQSGIMQNILVDRTDAKICYYDCMIERLADRVGESLSAKATSFEKRTVRGYGRIIVTVDSSSEKVNETVLAFIN